MKSHLTSKTLEIQKRGVGSSQFLLCVCVCKHVSVCAAVCWVDWEVAARHSELTDRAPSSSLCSAEANFGMGASSSIARLHSSARPTGTQSLCRFLGSFTVCQITVNPVLSVALLEHPLLLLPCQGLFWMHVLDTHTFGSKQYTCMVYKMHMRHKQMPPPPLKKKSFLCKQMHSWGVTGHPALFTFQEKQCKAGDQRDQHISIQLAVFLNKNKVCQQCFKALETKSVLPSTGHLIHYRPSWVNSVIVNKCFITETVTESKDSHCKNVNLLIDKRCQ